ncbi:MAG: sulfotransferase [Clostridiales bacterium]|nr:sulfotransferase [Clostridiales bacterium]MCF8022796.1 sulfotransferase [Clostridiales bacterium]
MLKIGKLISDGLNTFGGAVEKKILLKSSCKLSYPPVFIIGPPRSGTTLLYQLLVHSCDFAYFSNLSTLFWKMPVIASHLSKGFLKRYNSDFSSNYGRTKGLSAPHEAGEIWNRWFPKKYNYVTSGYLTNISKKEIYATVAAIENLYNAPFINKNVKNSVRILALKEIFPMAVFIEIQRNPISNAISILKGRKNNLKDINQWWSVMPKEVESLKDRNYINQIAGQLYYVKENIRKDSNICGKDSFYRLSYEELCSNPNKELKNILEFLWKRGVFVKKTKNFIPERFSQKTVNINSLNKEEAMLALKVENLFEQSEIISNYAEC